MRHEHRSLPVLIALGVLLGAGLAIASPAGHRAPAHRPTRGATETVSPSPSTNARPTPSVSSSPTGFADDRSATAPAACAHGASDPGWAAGQPPLAHAIHVLSSSCHPVRGRGLQTAIHHLHETAGRHGGGHGAGSGASGNGQATGGTGTGRGGHGPNSGGDATQPGHAGGQLSTGSGTTGGGVDIVHGNGKDGQHGNDLQGSGGNAAGSSGSDPTVRGSAGEHGNGGSKRPAVPPGLAR
jgi:hypothetical protein